MKRTRTSAIILTVGLMLLTAFPSSSEASIFKLWVGGRGDYFSGTSDLFTEFENEMGGALELGLTLLGISLFTEATMLGTDQYLFTLNGGLDFSFGGGPRLTIGAYTGPMLMVFPDTEVPSTVDFSGMPQEQVDALLIATGNSSTSELEQHFAQFSEAEQDLGSLAFGWNLIRGRLALDYPILPILYLGVSGQVGYHLIISGEDVAAGAKNHAIDAYVLQYDLPNEVTAGLRDAIGAREVDRENLNGINWNVNLYLRFELGL